MPELPEVTTTVKALNKVLPGLFVLDVWTDLAKKDQKIKQFKNTLKDKKFFNKFRRDIKGTKVKNVERRAKYILIHLSNKKTILIHLKMTGHLLFGKYEFNKKENKWVPNEKERKELRDPYNRFIHVVFTLAKSRQRRASYKNLVFCDARKFGKVTMIPTTKLYDKDSTLQVLGPEPLDNKFTFKQFKKRLLIKNSGKIKTLLMNQEIISGIGNIYSDEMLWIAGIHPESQPANIPDSTLKSLYKEMKEILKKGISSGGDSTSDYRHIDGKKGSFHLSHKVYKRKGKKCSKRGCSGVIIRKVINGRSAHFCKIHQKLF